MTVADPGSPYPRLEAFAVPGIGEVAERDDLVGLLLTALAAAGQALVDGDVVVMASKVVSKAEGRMRDADSREQAVRGETVRVVAERLTPAGVATRIVQGRAGPVMAAAGVDASNVPPGRVLLLPVDADASARALRAQLQGRTGRRLAVLVTDTAGRAWRDGQTDFALGAAGLQVTDDLRGARDGQGNDLQVTLRALADEVAALGDLLKGKLGGLPVAVVRGLGELVLPEAEDGPGAAALLRPPGADWFSLGPVEAVRSALGAPPGTPGIPPRSVLPETIEARLSRAVDLALGQPPWPGAPRIEVTWTDGQLLLAADSSAGALTALGALAQRLVVAGWSEDLCLDVEPPAGPDGGRLRVRVQDRPPTGG